MQFQTGYLFCHFCAPPLVHPQWLPVINIQNHRPGYKIHNIYIHACIPVSGTSTRVCQSTAIMLHTTQAALACVCGVRATTGRLTWLPASSTHPQLGRSCPCLGHTQTQLRQMTTHHLRKTSCLLQVVDYPSSEWSVTEQGTSAQLLVCTWLLELGVKMGQIIKQH